MASQAKIEEGLLMSIFSEELKKIINEKSMTVYGLSKKSGVERTSLQRTVSGDRLPSEEFIFKIFYALDFTPTQIQDFYLLYLKEKGGEDGFASIQNIQKLIECIANIKTIYPSTDENLQLDFTSSHSTDQEIQLIQGEYHVISFIKSIIHEYCQKIDKIKMFIPDETFWIFECLDSLYNLKHHDFEIQQIVPFETNSNSQTQNIKTLSLILPFALNKISQEAGYDVRWFQSSSSLHEQSSLIYPYYFITSDKLINVQSDFKSAICIQNPELVEAYNRNFDQIFKQCTPVMNSISCQCKDFIYFAQSDKCKKMFLASCVLEPLPCISRYVTKELLKKYVRSQTVHRDLVIDNVTQMYLDIQNNAKNYTSIFTVKGLKRFVETGVCAYWPNELIKPFDIEDRIKLLNLIKNDIINNSPNITFKALNPQKIKFPIDFSIYIEPKASVLLLITKKDSMHVCEIENAHISKSFLAFAEYLKNSAVVYSTEDCLCLIDECIEYLKQL